jgi:hypothetical protein
MTVVTLLEVMIFAVIFVDGTGNRRLSLDYSMSQVIRWLSMTAKIEMNLSAH